MAYQIFAGGRFVFLDTSVHMEAVSGWRIWFKLEAKCPISVRTAPEFSQNLDIRYRGACLARSVRHVSLFAAKAPLCFRQKTAPASVRE